MRLIERRIGLLFAVFCILLTAALGRAFWLQAVRGGELGAEASAQHTRSVVVPGHRGRILDRNGKELAVSEDAASVFATPYQIKDPAATAVRIAPLLGFPPLEVQRKLSNRGAGFEYLARKVDISIAERIKRLKIHGLGVLPDSRRVYPQGELASQVIGAVGIDNQGLSGLESGYESELHATDGEREVTKDALGKTIGAETLRGERAGEELRLTLDAAIQDRAEKALAEIGTTYSPRGATAIVMDPRSGRVLAMANWPPVDPADLTSIGEEDLQNRATGLTYEPGSTFKAFTVAAALEDRLVKPQTSFYLPPEIKVADRTIGEAHARGAVDLTVSDILAHSSNVGAVTIGLKLGAERFDPWIRRFGFGRPTAIGFPGEERGILPSIADYSGSTMGNLPIGQGLSVTPIQMAAAYSAIANGGILRRPQLVSEVEGNPTEEPSGHRVISARTSRKVREMMEGVLAPGGTASEVSVPGYTLGGKTGTAEKAINGVYSKTRFVASFVGFAPAERPRLLVSISVDEPQGDIYGGSVAAPAFGEIAEFALPYLQIPPG